MCSVPKSQWGTEGPNTVNQPPSDCQPTSEKPQRHTDRSPRYCHTETGGLHGPVVSESGRPHPFAPLPTPRGVTDDGARLDYKAIGLPPWTAHLRGDADDVRHAGGVTLPAPQEGPGDGEGGGNGCVSRHHRTTTAVGGNGGRRKPARGGTPHQINPPCEVRE